MVLNFIGEICTIRTGITLLLNIQFTVHTIHILWQDFWIQSLGLELKQG